MKKEYESQYHEIEKNHWWHKSRRNLIISFFQKTDLTNKKILDIGCSSGHLINDFYSTYFKEVYGIDISEAAILNCQNYNLNKTYLMDANKLDFEDESFDYIISSDSLEHLEYDVGALTEWNRVLKSTGELIIFVPAFNFLWLH